MDLDQARWQGGSACWPRLHGKIVVPLQTLEMCSWAPHSAACCRCLLDREAGPELTTRAWLRDPHSGGGRMQNPPAAPATRYHCSGQIHQNESADVAIAVSMPSSKPTHAVLLLKADYAAPATQGTMECIVPILACLPCNANLLACCQRGPLYAE